MTISAILELGCGVMKTCIIIFTYEVLVSIHSPVHKRMAHMRMATLVMTGSRIRAFSSLRHYIDVQPFHVQNYSVV